MSEQVGYINNLDLQEINDKFRIIQNLFDGIIFNDTHLKDYLNNSRHDLQERHTLGDVVNHDSIVNLTDVNIELIQENSLKLLRINEEYTGVELVASELAIDLFELISGTTNQIDVAGGSGDGSVTLSLSSTLIFPGTATASSLIVTNGGTIGQAAGALLTFDDTNNFLEITGCSVGIKNTAPDELLSVGGETDATDNYIAICSAGTNARGVKFQEGATIEVDANGDLVVKYNQGDAASIDFFIKRGSAESLVLNCDVSGNIGIGVTPTCVLDINADKFRLRTSKTPSSALDTGNAGDICWDSSFIYVCVGTNTWKKVGIATW